MISKRTMNLLIAINQSYIPVCKTMLFSFFSHHADREIQIFILNRTLTNKETDDMTQYIHKLGGKAIVISVADECFVHMPLVKNRFSMEIYFRIFAHRLLPETVDRVLWLDSDLILMGNIETFYDQCFDGKMLTVCRDFGFDSEEVKQIKEKMNIAEGNTYFNSGVILFDLNAIRITFDESKLLEAMRVYADVLVYPDQDLLNYIYQGNLKYADEIIYNYQVNDAFNVDVKGMGIKVLHYAGNKKPWIAKYARPVCKYYWQYQLRMKNYREYVTFYCMYYMLYLPKKIKRIKHPGF